MCCEANEVLSPLVFASCYWSLVNQIKGDLASAGSLQVRRNSKTFFEPRGIIQGLNRSCFASGKVKGSLNIACRIETESNTSLPLNIQKASKPTHNSLILWEVFKLSRMVRVQYFAEQDGKFDSQNNCFKIQNHSRTGKTSTYLKTKTKTLPRICKNY